MEPSKQHSPGTASDYLLCSLPDSACVCSRVQLCVCFCAQFKFVGDLLQLMVLSDYLNLTCILHIIHFMGFYYGQ